MAVIVLFTTCALSQINSNRIGDDDARAALRAIIYTMQSGITAQRISLPLLGHWISRSSVDHKNCYQALKANLKARNGATPEACR